MKNFWILITAAILLSSCSKKNYSSNTRQLSQQSYWALVTTSNDSAITTDRTITIKHRQYDTTFTISGDTLSGFIDLTADKEKLFSNGKLSIWLAADSAGLVKAIAIAKPKPFHVKVDEITSTYNNVATNQHHNLATKLKSVIKTDSLTNVINKQVDPAPANNLFKKLMLIVCLLVLAAVMLIYAFKKFIKA